jgi:hypothetical protein
MRKKQKTEKRYVFEIEKPSEDKRSRYTAWDFLAVAAVTLIYCLIAFINLGDTKAPQEFWRAEMEVDLHNRNLEPGGEWLAKKGAEVVIEFDGEFDVSQAFFYLGRAHAQFINVSFSHDGEEWTEVHRVKLNSVFAWSVHPIYGDGGVRYVRIGSMSQEGHAAVDDRHKGDNELWLGQVGFRDAEGGLIPIKGISSGATGNYAAIIANQDLVPTRLDYMNSTYFDEIYHPRTAFEMLHGEPVYETTHPQLGKLIMAFFINIFGMTPFGWRFAGALFGVLMVPVLYFFVRDMFKSTFWATFAATLFAADFMHFAQTRLATIDTYLVFFVMCMYYAMYKYYTMSFYETKFWKTLIPLCLSGIFMGLGIASKWPAMYAGIGLGVIFFYTMYKRWCEMEYAKRKNLDGNYDQFKKLFIKTCLWCVLFFVVIPLVIYVLSFIPYHLSGNLYPDTRERLGDLWFGTVPKFWLWILPDNGVGNFLLGVISSQVYMLWYHSDYVLTVDNHPFSSPWWQWVLNIRPIWYYSGTVAQDTVKQGISAFGNPVVWWGGLTALIYSGYHFYKKHDKTLLFLFIAFAAQLVPWVFVSRMTFIYHYFPCVPFLIMFTVYGMKLAFGETVVAKRVSIGYAAAAVLLFAVFYPVLAGVPMDVSIVQNWLRWIPSWQLI